MATTMTKLRPPVIPHTTKAVVIKRSQDPKKPVYHEISLVQLPLSSPKPQEVVVKMSAAGYNHRDLWQRKGQYPAIDFGGVMGADGAGVVVASGNNGDSLLNKRVFLNPTRGWRNHPDAPEEAFSTLGASVSSKIGTFSEYVCVERDQVILTPPHLDDVHAAAWPLAGVTAWRALRINLELKPTQNILITGIGGGVALVAMQLCLAMGANVYVSSSSNEKIRKAVELGAKGGVNYTDDSWPHLLKGLLVDNSASNPQLDAVLDSAGGDLLDRLQSVLKKGGRMACYGMTATPKITFTMRHVLANQKLIGTTMGSLADLKDATDFISEHHIKPIVSHVLSGLENAEDGFQLMKSGEQFGKIVVEIGSTNKGNAKL